MHQGMYFQDVLGNVSKRKGSSQVFPYIGRGQVLLI